MAPIPSVRTKSPSARMGKWQTHHFGMHTMSGEREGKISWLAVLRVGELMTRPAICVSSETSLGEARQLMKQHAFRRLPVVDEGKLVGILTLEDVRGAWPSEITTLNRFEQDYLIRQVKVERVMNREVITVAPEARLVKAARLMIDHKIGALPVVSRQGQVIGIVTESDIFRALVALMDADPPVETGNDPSQPTGQTEAA